MIDHKKYTEILQWHKGIEYFDYNPTIDWAIELIRKGIETENVLIVASFSKPVDREEIRPYITGALKELNLTEKYGEYSVIAAAHYYLEQIINDYEIRKNLLKLHEIYLNANMDSRLEPFYLLYHGWGDLEEMGENYYFDGADLDNIEAILKEQAQIWIDKFVHGNEIEEKIDNVEKAKMKNLSIETKENSLWQTVKNIWKKK